MRARKQTPKGNTKQFKGIIPHLKNHPIPLNIEDFLPKTTGTDPFVFELTMKVFENLQNIYFTHQFEEKTVKMTHDTLFGFIYSMVQRVFEEMGKTIDPKRVEDLVSFNLTNYFLFFEPVNITDEEETWVEDHLKRTNDSTDKVLLSVPLNHKKYYLINLKRILDRNRNNPEFNDSILDFMGDDDCWEEYA